jgi:hypothetical protein
MTPFNNHLLKQGLLWIEDQKSKVPIALIAALLSSVKKRRLISVLSVVMVMMIDGDRW